MYLIMPLCPVESIEFTCFEALLPQNNWFAIEMKMVYRIEVNRMEKNFQISRKKLTEVMHVGSQGVNSLGDTFKLHENSICFANKLRTTQYSLHLSQW